ncbi:MAG: imidazolonepropionase-like amidohydrolase [Cognaticolwellia sp.]|jgi:imidazolonepropionase-like amidohydrolase
MTLLLTLVGSLLGCAAQAAPNCQTLRGAQIWTPQGIASGDVTIAGEKIVAIGSETVAGWRGDACPVVDLSGSLITPGFIDSLSQLGLVEVEMEGGSRTGGGGRPSHWVANGYNPLATAIPVTRVRGITGVVITPTGGSISGQAAFASLAGQTQGQALQPAPVAMVSSLGLAMNTLQIWRENFEDAQEYNQRRPAYAKGETREYSLPKSDLEALLPVLSGEMPLVVRVNRSSDIEALLRFATDFPKLRLILSGAAEAWMHAPALADAKIPVILNAFNDGPGGFDSLHGRADNATLLHQAGVPVILSTFSAMNGRELSQYAGNAVRAGLPYEAAIAAVTSIPAHAFGLENYGVLRVGAQASIVAWQGDPLELRTQVSGVWIDGRPQNMDTRQTELLNRYQSLPGRPLEMELAPE